MISIFEDRTERLRAEAERRRLERVTEAALTHLALNELLDELLARLIELLDADTVAIFLLDEAGDTLEIRATIGLESGAADRRVPLGGGFAGAGGGRAQADDRRRHRRGRARRTRSCTTAGSTR